jgi:hypothetical protein
MSHDAVVALGLGFGDPVALDSVHFSWLTIPLLGAIGQYLKRFLTTAFTFRSQRDSAMLFCMENLYYFKDVVCFHLGLSGALLLSQMAVDIQHQQVSLFGFGGGMDIACQPPGLLLP